MAPSELPFTFAVILIASTLPTLVDEDLTTPGGVISVGLTALTLLGFAIIARRALQARDVLRRALHDSFTVGGRGDSPMPKRRRPRDWARTLLLPWPFLPRDIERVKDLPYGEGGAENLVDVYRHRSKPTDGPCLIYFHGGRFRWGGKSREARPLLYHLARHGWTCLSANYHLSATPSAGFPRHLVDVKKVIDWARTTGHDHGIDADSIVLAGSSAGAHLTVMAALTANDPTFQPGFESADTSVRGGIGFYGYYGALGGEHDVPSAPHAYVHAGAPPLMIVHGTNDTYTPVEGARLFVQRLRSVSPQPTVYAELPGAQHSFDVFHSIRFEAVVDAVAAFATSLCQSQRTNRP
jgi:acetyl esterase/lipase